MIQLLHGCASGPAAAELMVRPDDAAGYRHQLELHGGDPAEAWLAWRSQQSGSTTEDVRRADRAISRTGNPFSPDDLQAVRLGALVYQTSCIDCHGKNANGLDESGQPLIGRKDFTHSHMRMALKMNPDRLNEWFAMVEQGVRSEHPDTDGNTAVMPPMGDMLTREQIWLALNWLASDRKLEAEVRH